MKSVREARRGMTVLELVVAIALLGVLVAISGSVLDATATGSRGVTRAGEEAARAGIARHTFRALLASARADEGRVVFEGGPARARFTSFCPDASGDVRRCSVTISATSEPTASDVAIERWSQNAPLIHLRGLELVYLTDDTERRARPEWLATDRVPAAIGVASGRDTSWFPVGRP